MSRKLIIVVCVLLAVYCGESLARNLTDQQYKEVGLPLKMFGDTFKFVCTNGSHKIPYAVDILPEDTFETLVEYRKQRCKEESPAWNKFKNTKGDYKFSTNQF